MEAFLASLPKLPDSSEMHAWDQAAIEFGIPETMLMENAAQAILESACGRFGDFRGRQIWLFMGSGNNGGDAACLARKLLDQGAFATVFCARDPDALHGAAAFHAGLARKAGVKFTVLPARSGADPAGDAFSLVAQQKCLPDLIVDGLLGTGFAGELRPDLAALIECMNYLARLRPTPVLAIDIPSGLNAVTGRAQPVAICADLTVTLAAAKPGLVLPEARKYTGQLVCRGIGIPVSLSGACPAGMRLLDGRALLQNPDLPQGSYKNIYGHVLIFGGAEGYAGACRLACAAALRKGAGLVTACAPGASLSAVRMGWPEIMTLPAAAGEAWPDELSGAVKAALKSASALVIGPGMGRSAGAASFLAALLAESGRPPAVLDADALFLLGQDRSLLRLLTASDVLTPHPGEAGFLLASSSREVQADRFAAIAALVGLSDAAVVLKGAGTLLGQKGAPGLICPYDIPDLAIGGAGDTLAGCIGALLASRLLAQQGALARSALGVITHAMAALSLSRQYPERGFTASQLADALPFAGEFVRSRPDSCTDAIPWPKC